MISSHLDKEDGSLYLRWESGDGTESPGDIVSAFQSFIQESGALECCIWRESHEVVAGLLKLPGFTVFSESFELSRSCPSEIDSYDMTGIRIVTRADEPLIYDILFQTGLIYENREDLQKIFGTNSYSIVFTEAGRDVGFGSISHGNGVGWISYIAVLAEARRRGFGRRIMENLLVEMDKYPLERITLSTGTIAKAALRLYAKFGFVQSSPSQVHLKYKQPG